MSRNTCKNCGAPCLPDARFCTECGTRIVEHYGDAPSAGFPGEGAGSFGGVGCGAADGRFSNAGVDGVPQDAANRMGATAEGKRGGKKIAIVIAIVAAVVVVAVVVAAVLLARPGKAPSSPASEDASSSAPQSQAQSSSFAMGGTYILDTAAKMKLVISGDGWAAFEGSEAVDWGNVKKSDDEAMSPSEASGLEYGVDYLLLLSGRDGTLLKFGKAAGGGKGEFQLDAAKHITSTSAPAAGVYSKQSETVSQELSDEVERLNKQGSESKSTQKGGLSKKAREAYAKKINELIGEYGSPSIERGEQSTYATGVVLAKLLDFGAGYEYLLVAYHDPAKDTVPSAPASKPESYCVEVWSYDKSLNRLYSGTGKLAGQNVYCVSLEYIEMDGKAYIKDEVREDGPNGSNQTSLWGLDDDAVFRVIQTAWLDWGSKPANYEIDGVAVSEDEYNSVTGKWREGAVTYLPTALDSTSRGSDVEKTVATVQETLDQLAQ